jgi:hypothetical protein
MDLKDFKLKLLINSLYILSEIAVIYEIPKQHILTMDLLETSTDADKLYKSGIQ